MTSIAQSVSKACTPGAARGCALLRADGRSTGRKQAQARRRRPVPAARRRPGRPSGRMLPPMPAAVAAGQGPPPAAAATVMAMVHPEAAPQPRWPPRAVAAGARRRAGSSTDVELANLTVKELRKQCRELGLESSGTKNQLIRRLEDYEAADNKDDQWDDMDDIDLEGIFDIKMPAPGEIVKGTVVNLVEWGAFCELEGDADGWTGLIHISEVSDDFVDNIEDYLHPGQQVEAMVIVGPSHRMDRLSLSLRMMQSLDVDEQQSLQSQAQEQRRAAISAQMASSLALLPPALTPRQLHNIERMEKLEVRLNAIESVLLQLGHGPVIHNWIVGMAAPTGNETKLMKQRKLVSQVLESANAESPEEEEEDDDGAEDKDMLDALRPLGFG